MEIIGQPLSARSSADRRRDLVIKFDQFVDLFDREISRYNIVPADSEIIHFLLNTVSDILEDCFAPPDLGESEYEETVHYWSKYSEAINSDTIKFVNSLEQFSSDSEKAYVWILIELHNRNLATVFEEITSTPAIMNCYFPRSLIKKHYQEIFDILKKLSKIRYKVESKFLKAYEDYQNTSYGNEMEPDMEIQGNIAAQSPKGHRSFEFLPPKRETSGEFQPNLSLDSPTIFPVAAGSLENTRTSSLFNKSGSSIKGRLEVNVDKNKDSMELYKNQLDMYKFEGIDEAPDMTSIEEIKGESQDASKTVTPRWRHRRQNSKVRKSSSFQHLNCQVQDSILQGEENLISPLHYSNLSPKSDNDIRASSPLEQSPNLIEKRGYQIQESPIPSEDEGYPVQLETAKKRFIISGFSGIKSDYHNSYDTPIFRGAEKVFPHTAFSCTNLSPVLMKHSELLYVEVFEKLLQMYQYRERPRSQVKIGDQENNCFSCGKNLSKKFLFFWPKMGYCHYTGQWYCEDCMAVEGSMIPWYVVEKWDFKNYPVCKKAQRELLQMYDKPNVVIDYGNPIIQRNKVLYDTLVARRQIHLMYDMICEPNMMLEKLEEDQNFLLKQNIFSLKNLHEISRGTVLIYLEKCCSTINKHIAGCESCQSKGKFCEICMQEPKIFPYDIKNTAICHSCKRLYHSSCYSIKKCHICK